MKQVKKLLALVLALAMVLSMGVTVFATTATSQTIDSSNAADENGKYTISVADGDTHTYTVYQILTGTLVSGESELGDPVWGEDAVSDTGSTDGVADFITDITASNLSDAEIDNIVNLQLSTTAAGRGTVSAKNTLSVVPGYYLIKDTTETLNDGDAYSLNLVAVFNNITITPKKGTTTSDKKVDDNDSDVAADQSEWIDSADYSIGDTVPYKLSATIAEDYENYTYSYKLTFHDQMSEGLTFDASPVVVKVDGNRIENGYEVVTSGLTDGCTFEVRFADLKKISAVSAGSKITVEFNATLNADAVIGAEGNPNTSHITYTNNPNDVTAGENGKTPDDTVIVFTYETVFNKVDGEGKPLTGADFTLYKKVNGGWVDVTALHTGDADNPTKTTEALTMGDDTAESAKFTFAGLDAGEYKLEETQTPEGYNKIDDIEFTISAAHEILSDNPALTSLAGTNGSSFTMTAVESDGAPTGELDANIKNNQGSILPSTGGMGTKILYIVGAVLVLGAGVVLVSRKRANAK